MTLDVGVELAAAASLRTPGILALGTSISRTKRPFSSYASLLAPSSACSSPAAAVMGTKRIKGVPTNPFATAVSTSPASRARSRDESKAGTEALREVEEGEEAEETGRQRRLLPNAVAKGGDGR